VTVKEGTVETETLCDGEATRGEADGLVAKATLAAEETEEAGDVTDVGFWQETRLTTAKSDKRLSHDFFIKFLQGMKLFPFISLYLKRKR
jgi:hypothetical protein